MPAFLQRVLGQMPAGHHRHLRVQFVRAVQRFRAQHHHRVFVAGTPFGHQQIVPAVFTVNMRPFGVGQRRAGEEGFTLGRQGAGLRIKFLHHDGVVWIAVMARPPRAINVVFAAIVVVEQGGIKPAVAHRDRLTPGAFDGGGRYQEVTPVFPRRIDNFHIGIEQPELPVGVAQARRPDPAGIRVALHIQHRYAIQRGTHQPPVFQVAGVVYAHAREPLKG